MKIFIGADHRGFSLKQQLVEWLNKDYGVEDMGAQTLDPHDDYTLYAGKVASMVSVDTSHRGILLCGSGVGVDVVANKIDGVRASIGINAEQVTAGREDDNMNVLVIAADFFELAAAKKMVTAFLETEFSSEARHKRRLAEISRIEENN